MSAQRKKRKPPRGRNRSPDDDDDPVPADIDEFRLELARRIATFVQAWRTCRRPPCRRARRCAARTTCASIANRVPPSPHEDAAVMANVYRQVQRRLAEVDAAQHEEAMPSHARILADGKRAAAKIAGRRALAGRECHRNRKR